MSSPATMPGLEPGGVLASPEQAPGQVARVGVLGASGYSGQEFVRLALAHPGLELVALASREHAGQPGAAMIEGIDGREQRLPDVVDPSAMSDLVLRDACDTIVACLPHGAWREFAENHPHVLDRAVRIVDLSADCRSAEGWTYGLPEAFADEIRRATRLANPGCYATAAALALLPAAEAGLLAGAVSIGALSGVTGAGRAPKLRTSLAELDGGAAFYQVGTVHNHVAEMERTLVRVGAAAGPAPMPRVAFAPQLAPMARGILLTATVSLAHPMGPDAARERWTARYASAPFVRVLGADVWPETRAVRQSNRCDLGVTTVHDGAVLLVTAAIDNLGKGAAGQAIQNLNLMLGWPETTGLPQSGVPW